MRFYASLITETVQHENDGNHYVYRQKRQRNIMYILRTYIGTKLPKSISTENKLRVSLYPKESDRVVYYRHYYLTSTQKKYI